MSETLTLLGGHDEVWKNEVRLKITAGMDSIRAGRTISAERVQTEMTAFKKKRHLVDSSGHHVSAKTPKGL